MAAVPGVENRPEPRTATRAGKIRGSRLEAEVFQRGEDVVVLGGRLLPAGKRIELHAGGRLEAGARRLGGRGGRGSGGDRGRGISSVGGPESVFFGAGAGDGRSSSSNMTSISAPMFSRSETITVGGT